MNLRKRIALSLALACLMLLLSPAALAWTPRYPEQQGLICDSAAVLSAGTVSDLDAFNGQLADETGLQLAVVTVDFLDGATLDDYCDGLRAAWELPEDTALLLMAVGEDKFTLNGTLCLESRTCAKLLSAYLEGPFLAQDYDGALRAFIPALSQELDKALDVEIDLSGLFGQEATPSVSVDEWAESWLQRWEDEDETGDATPMERFVEEDERSGFSLGKVILTVFLLLVIFGNSGRARRQGHPGGCGCSGCGCAPFSSLLAGLGLWRLWGGDRPPRRPRR